MSRSRQFSRRPGHTALARGSRARNPWCPRRGFFEPLEPRLVLSVSVWGGTSGEFSPGASLTTPADPDLAPLPDHTLHDILIGFEGGASSSFRTRGPAAALAAAGLTQHGLHSPRVLLDTKDYLATCWKLPDTADLASVMREISTHPGVAFAEPNFTYTVAETLPSDPLFSELYGLHNTGQNGGTPDADIDAPEAWDITTGSTHVAVGVIDTGVDYTHPDLYRNIWINQREIPTGLAVIDCDGDGRITFGDLNNAANRAVVQDTNSTGFIDAGDILHDPLWTDGIDFDKNGYVDDLIGWDFANNDNDPYDDHGHGTHVSGTIGALANNGLGGAGVAWNVQIIPLKFLDAYGGGSTADAVRAVNYAGQTDARLTTNSWTGTDFSETLRAAIADANLLFVAAAGNGNTDADLRLHYPAGYDLDQIVSVAATDRYDAKASFSNWGATTVDLAAPGVDVLSTVPGGGYWLASGTSMAAPHVAGTAALAWSLAETADWATIRHALFDGVDYSAAFAQDGPTPVATGGRLSAWGTLKRLGLVASLVDPAAGSVTADAGRLDFTVDFSYPITRGENADTALIVNGQSSAHATVTDDDTVVFTFSAPPIQAEGLQYVSLVAGSFVAPVSLPGGPAVHPMSATFRHDLHPVSVDATVPAGPRVTLPMDSLTVHFDEPIAAASASADDLWLSIGTVTNVTVVDAQTLTFEIVGLTAEGSLTATIPAGAVTDSLGNPMAPYQATMELDFDRADVPTRLSALPPTGSLAHSGTFVGNISWHGDVDQYDIELDPNQTLTLLMQRADGSSIEPVIDLYAGTERVIPMSETTSPQTALKTYGVLAGGLYTVTVGAAGTATGGYQVQLYLNIVMEHESWDGMVDNDSRATAQVLDATFTPLVDGTDRTVIQGGMEDNGCTLPDGFGYEAALIDYGFLDISSSPTAHLILKTDTDDDAEVLLKGKTLSGFQFPFYGQVYSQVIIGGNGQITFEWERRYGFVVNNSSINHDLTTSPNVATIAPFWADLEIAGDHAGVYWEVLGSGSNQQLVIQFEQVRFWTDPPQPSPDTMTFQMILSEADGSITINYKDLSCPDPRAEGAGATVGIKDVGTQGPNRLVLAFNDGPNRWVGSGKSVRIGRAISDPLATTDDFYRFDLETGQPATVALATQAGACQVELLDAAGDPVGTLSTGHLNVDRALYFAGGSAGTYYAKVAGQTRSEYRLLVVRGGQFDVEENSGPAPWAGDPFQTLALDDGNSARVLGYLGGISGHSPVVGYYTDNYWGGTTPPAEVIVRAGLVPVQIEDITTFDLTTIDILMLNEADNRAPSREVLDRLDDVAAWVATGGVFVVHDRFVTNDTRDPQPNPFLVGAPQVLADRDAADALDIDVIPPGDTLVTNGSHGEIDNDTLDGEYVYYSNHGFVLADSLATIEGRVEAILSAGPETSDVVAFSYGLGNGHVYYATIPLDYYLGGDNNLDAIYAPNMLEYAGSLASPASDFFQIEVPPLLDGGVLSVQTLVPGAAAGEFQNRLDSKVQVYDAAGNLVASGDNPDGTATVEYPLAANAESREYYVQVLASDAPDATPTRGEYALVADVIPTPPPPGIAVSKNWLTTGEPDVADPFAVVLNSAPKWPVDITVSVTDATEARLRLSDGTLVSAVTLRYSAANWSVAQTVTVLGWNDDVADGDIPYGVTLSSTSDDVDYDGIGKTIPALNRDDDTVGFSLSTDLLVTGETGRTATFGIALTSEPFFPVTVTVETDDTSEGLLSFGTQGPAGFVTLEFSPTDWSVAREIVVTGRDDSVDDGNVDYRILVTALSADLAYDALDPRAAAAINLDDEINDMTLRVIDDFEDGSLSEYTEIGISGTKLALQGARDGTQGLVDDYMQGWLCRTDRAAQVRPGDVISTWVRAQQNADGRAYFGFGAVTKGRASAQGTLALVMAPNTNSLTLQHIAGFDSFSDLASVGHVWVADKWYRLEVEWGASGLIVGRLFDSDGTTLLKAVTASNTTFKGGGIAFRAFGSDKNFDTVELRKAPLTAALHAVGVSDSAPTQDRPTHEQLQAAMGDALAYWAAAGIPTPRLSSMSQADIRVVDLPGSLLGVSSSSNSIWLDDDAAGFGWSAPVASSLALWRDRDALVTVLTHELGHLAGFDHDAPWAVMRSHVDLSSNPTAHGELRLPCHYFTDTLLVSAGRHASDGCAVEDAARRVLHRSDVCADVTLSPALVTAGSAVDALFLELETRADEQLQRRRRSVTRGLLRDQQPVIDDDLTALLADDRPGTRAVNTRS